MVGRYVALQAAVKGDPTPFSILFLESNCWQTDNFSCRVRVLLIERERRLVMPNFREEVTNFFEIRVANFH